MYVCIAKQIQEVSSKKESNTHSHANDVEKQNRCGCCKRCTFEETCLKITFWAIYTITCGFCVLCTHPDDCETDGTCCNCEQCFLNDCCCNCCKRIDDSCKGSRCYDHFCQDDGCWDKACRTICCCCVEMNSFLYEDDDDDEDGICTACTMHLHK